MATAMREVSVRHRECRLIVGVALAAWGLCCTPAFAACHYPLRPNNLPDGSTATPEEMVAAQKLVQQYNTDMAEYLKCLDAESPKPDAVTSNLSDAQQQALSKQIELIAERKGAAVADEQAVVARFNEQVQVFKARQATKN